MTEFSAALKRHGITIDQFEELLQSDSDVRSTFDSVIHFPFIGLVKEKGKTSFEGAAVLARPASLPLGLSNCSSQSLKAVLKKYYMSLLFKTVCLMPNKRCMHERFQGILALLTDPKELGQVIELYGLKLESTMFPPKEVEEMTQSYIATSTEPCTLTEASKAYYSYVLDKAWA